MLEFLRLIASFPTVVFTAPLAVLCGYWLLVVLGAFEFDLGIEGLDEAADSEADFDAADLLGLGGVPPVIVGSFWMFFGWVLSLSAAGATDGSTLLGLSRLVVGIVVLIAAALGGLILAALVGRAMKGLFVVHPAVGKASFLGKTCTVKTLKVDERFGQAEIEGTFVLAEVRCPSPNNLTRGSKAMLADYRGDADVFDVEPLDIQP